MSISPFRDNIPWVWIFCPESNNSSLFCPVILYFCEFSKHKPTRFTQVKEMIISRDQYYIILSKVRSIKPQELPIYWQHHELSRIQNLRTGNTLLCSINLYKRIRQNSRVVQNQKTTYKWSFRKKSHYKNWTWALLTVR